MENVRIRILQIIFFCALPISTGKSPRNFRPALASSFKAFLHATHFPRNKSQQISVMRSPHWIIDRLACLSDSIYISAVGPQLATVQRPAPPRRGDRGGTGPSPGALHLYSPYILGPNFELQTIWLVFQFSIYNIFNKLSLIFYVRRTVTNIFVPTCTTYISKAESELDLLIKEEHWTTIPPGRTSLLPSVSKPHSELQANSCLFPIPPFSLPISYLQSLINSVRFLYNKHNTCWANTMPNILVHLCTTYASNPSSKWNVFHFSSNSVYFLQFYFLTNQFIFS